MVECSTKSVTQSLLTKCVIVANVSIKFWLEIIKEKDEHVIINGICYYLDKAHPMSDSPFRGYGGREFKIKLHTGEIIVTNNLWHNGEVPKEFRDRLPDNAEFVK